MPNEGQTRCATEAKGLVQNRSDMLDCGFKRYETGSDMKCSKVGTWKTRTSMIEARDLAAAKRSERLPWRPAEKAGW